MDLQFDCLLTFDNVVIGSWGDKTFNVKVNILDDTSTAVQLTHDFVVTSADLTLVSGDIYTYTGSHFFTQKTTKIVSVVFSPVSNTRLNTAEIDAELNVKLTSQTIITDDYTNTLTLNANINKYVGVVTEVIETTPDNTTDIDIIIKFPQGLYKVNTDGSRAARTTTVS